MFKLHRYIIRKDMYKHCMSCVKICPREVILELPDTAPWKSTSSAVTAAVYAMKTVT